MKEEEKHKDEREKEIRELIRVKIDIYGLTEQDIADLREHARRMLNEHK
ncbi:MAG: hypothetical protein J6S14_12950 [Clostridia bacterium]|nr:hypothetical protein [Clostridia bacterium]